LLACTFVVLLLIIVGDKNQCRIRVCS
jgi:hypothetical protein